MKQSDVILLPSKPPVAAASPWPLHYRTSFFFYQFTCPDGEILLAQRHHHFDGWQCGAGLVAFYSGPHGILEDNRRKKERHKNALVNIPSHSKVLYILIL